MNIYRPDHFILQELIGPATFRDRGEQGWCLLSPDLLRALDQVRDYFGPITVNNWHEGGSFHESGLRDFDTATGAKWSMHKYGRAADCKFPHADPREVQDYILAHPFDFSFITCMEDAQATERWLHVDVRNHDRAGIWIVQP